MKERLERALQRERQFTSDASHELRTPIAGLRAELEDAWLHSGEIDMDGVLERALRNLDRLQAIVEDLFLLVHLDTAWPARTQPVNLARLVDAEISRRSDRDRVQLSMDPYVTVDAVEDQIGRVLSNLLDNAHRHAERLVLVQVRREAGAAELTVTNDGRGVPEADRDRIFDLFARVDTSRSRDLGGTGLGLTIAREITQAHHGTLTVEGTPAGGVRFVLRLPVNAEPDL
ncbi:signal transduction histidine kinase [Streptosporangium brasiliense]|uniref:histidine kinase n=2 Tax=Streptosporangium TaxID=2000 RepID=A0ABT9RJE8_9ACTN|nr:HAMP domain-containing sensor histidine kinase [Streptosporangium brasiliense]MDP9869414.1 signal transduction histidine kinase [Streptosporangium brasiliense]